MFNRVLKNEKCPYSEFSWSAFSRIWTEYGEILSHRIQFEYGKLMTRKTSTTGTQWTPPVLILPFIKFFQNLIY